MRTRLLATAALALGLIGLHPLPSYARFDALDDSRTQLARDLGIRAEQGACQSQSSSAAAIRFVVGTARLLRNQDDNDLADEVMTNGGLGSLCAYLLLHVTQDWTIDQTGTSPRQESGSLATGYPAGTWDTSGWALPSAALGWSAYSAPSTVQACQSGEYRTSYAAGDGSTVGVTFGSYGLTPLRGGGTTAPTALVRLYATNADAAGTATLPTRAVSHTGGCDGLADSTTTETIGDPPFSDPEAIAPADRAAQGWGGEFRLSGDYRMTHDFALTTSSPVSDGTRTVTEHFTVLIQPT
ncbi:MAG: hypothetical protein QM572_10275 [Nocardioides sp.]|uniref:hypothetical protein n=1 Tax=Nocardioides sp. TaxID=35761 RepID=UPI0039E62ADC